MSAASPTRSTKPTHRRSFIRTHVPPAIHDRRATTPHANNPPHHKHEEEKA